MVPAGHSSNGVTAVHLSCEQAEVVKDRITPMLGYLSKLRRRMEQLRMDDQLYHDVVRAQMAMQDLHSRLHYLTCEHGVGRSR